MQAESAANLFQTTADLVRQQERELRQQRTGHLGEPVQLPSKPLALVVRSNEAWVAESGFVIRRIDLVTGKTLQLYKGHTGPVTSLALWTPPASSNNPKPAELLFSGSWDKTVKVWSTETKKLLTTISIHSDFVKTLLVGPHPTHPFLLTGSSDKTLKLTSLTSFLSCPFSSSLLATDGLSAYQTIKDHTRPVTRLESGQEGLYSGDSMGRVIVWCLSWNEGQDAQLTEVRRFEGGKTSVSDLAVVEDEGVWISSMDLSTSFHPYPTHSNATPRALSLPTLPNPRPSPLSLLPLPLSNLLLVGFSDDSLRIYSTAKGEGEAELVSVQEGHAGEVCALAEWRRGGEQWVVSAGLDRTLRKWKVADLLQPPPPPPVEKKASGMTEEEERELAELMGDD